jgi:hypothetical protein
MITVRPYQRAIMDAVLDSVRHRRGRTFSVEISRQGGKNETSAQLEVLLMTMHFITGGNIIKCSPTFKPQTLNSKMRLEDRLTDWGFGNAYQSEFGYMIRLGNARTLFFSADKNANVVGATAHVLLEIDESQDVDKEKYTKEFKPMGATTNVTTVHYGTTWDDTTLLEETKQMNLEQERKDGIKRHFRFDWQEVAKYNPDYRRYVEAERDRLGADHPLFLTQYCLEPIKGGGRFFNERQLAQLQGAHPRQPLADPSKTYVAGLDLAGEIEVDEEHMMSVAKRDSSIMTIAEVNHMPGNAEPFLNIVQIYAWLGVKHSTVEDTFVDLIKNVWNLRNVVVDATGIGEPVASHLEARCGSIVTPYKFTQQSKSHLAFGLLAAVNSGRLKQYTKDNSTEAQEFWQQMKNARGEFRPNQTMNFFVDPSQGHDDYLMSLALVAEAGATTKNRTAKGRTS